MNTQVKRKLDTKRLYKLTKIVVIVSVLFIILKLALFDWNAQANVANTWNTAEKSCDLLYSLDSKRDCWTKDSKELDSGMAEAIQLVQNDIIFIILIPLLFFGGTMIYRYLFPKRKLEII